MLEKDRERANTHVLYRYINIYPQAQSSEHEKLFPCPAARQLFSLPSLYPSLYWYERFPVFFLYISISILSVLYLYLF